MSCTNKSNQGNSSDVLTGGSRNDIELEPFSSGDDACWQNSKLWKEKTENKSVECQEKNITSSLKSSSSFTENDSRDTASSHFIGQLCQSCEPNEPQKEKFWSKRSWPHPLMTTAIRNSFLVNLFLEGLNIHYGPFPLTVSSLMSLGMLKNKVFSDFQIHPSYQKWILGSHLIQDDSAILGQYDIGPGSFVYLYIDCENGIYDQICKKLSYLQLKSTSSPFQEPVLGKSINKGGHHAKSTSKYSKFRSLSFQQPKNVDQGLSHILKKQDNVSNIVKKLQFVKRQHSLPEITSENIVENAQVDSSSLVTLDDLKQQFDNDSNVTGDQSDGADNNQQLTCSVLEKEPRKRCTDSSNISTLETHLNKDTDTDVSKEAVEVKNRENYFLLLQLESLNLISNVEAFDCPVCFLHIKENDGIILRDCLHTFCRECLACAVRYNDESSVRCPYRDNTYSCRSHLQHREVKALVSADVYEQYLQRSLATAESVAEKSFHCLSVDCPGWCLYEDNVNIFHCPVCSRFNCLTCSAIHEGFNCRQYQDQLRASAAVDKDAQKTLELLDQMMKDGKALKCPKCCVFLMKKWGCDWVKCSVCRTEVCWITRGLRWGPNGRGDTSGGCKCGVDGKKCHSLCTYCH